MEQEIVDQIEVPEQTAQEETEAVQPTKSVKNFWERLDEVFTQNTELRQKMEEVVEQFPSEEKVKGDYKSFIFQPERLAISSNNSVIPSNSIAWQGLIVSNGHTQAESFSSFRVRLAKSLVNAKSMQLLSAVIPNAIQNIPDNQVIFFYYRIRNLTNANLGAYNNATEYNPGDIVTFLGNTFVAIVPTVGLQPTGGQIGTIWLQITLPVDLTRPNYYDLNPYNIQIVFLQPTFGYPPEETGQYDLYNRTFTDYGDLLVSLNACANSGFTASLPGDIVFTYNEQLNKFQFQGADVGSGYYYMPCGYEDQNIVTFMDLVRQGEVPSSGLLLSYKQDIYSPGYSLNLRLGFTWNGIFPNPFITPGIYTNVNSLPALLFWYIRQKDPAVSPIGTPWNQPLLTANSYADLVNTSCVRIYTDIALTSTEDSSQQEGLLSVVPVNTTNLGVGFYQNNFNNPLTKIPRIISEIGFRLVNDQGEPYLLPNSATVLLELAITYH